MQILLFDAACSESYSTTKPIFNSLREKFKHIDWKFVNTDGNKEMRHKFNVKKTPLWLFLHRNHEVRRLNGTTPRDYLLRAVSSFNATYLLGSFGRPV